MRSLGQSFCVDEELLGRMVAYADLSVDDTVLEVGSGLGFLTRLLSEACKRVIAVELDPTLLEALRDHLKGRGNIRITPGNILEVELPSFDKVVANPPYSISSPLIMLLLKRSFKRAVLTLQKEFAERLIAHVGTRDYGPLAAIADYKVSAEVVEHLPRDTFYPQPKVESVVVLIKTHPPKFNVVDERLFFRVVEYLFTQRNRKVRSPLESFLKEAGMKKAEAGIIVEGLPFTETRVYDVKPENFGALSDRIYPFLQSRRITFKGRSFYVFPEVYQPSDDTFLLAEHLDVREGERILDVGTGCGLLGVVAAERAGSVVAADVNPHALECAKFNAKLNHVAEKVDTVLSDLFAGFNEDAKFDLVVSNPPYLPADERIRSGKWLERAWYGGRSGREVIDRFLNSVGEHLAKNGRVLMVQSTLSNTDESLRRFREMGFEADVVAKEELFFEEIVVIQAKKSL